MHAMKIIVAIVMMAIPIIVISLYKPSRILLPEAYGLSCQNDVCVEDESKRDSALQLIATARSRLLTRYGLHVDMPGMVFCSSESCKQTFGLNHQAAYTLGTAGIVVAPRGWTDYYIAHELIHHWQATNFGSLILITGEPWLIEGMAYALSDDPRNPLKPPFEQYRLKFNTWYQNNTQTALASALGKML